MKNATFCSWPLDEIVVLSDGSVTSCCLDPEKKNVFANIYEHDARDVYSNRYQSFRDRMAENITNYPHCLTCFTHNSELHRNKEKKYLAGESWTRADFVVKGYAPKWLVIELSSACNLKCVDCVHANISLNDFRYDKKLFLDTTILSEWIKPVLHNLEGIRLYNYGETFLHPGAIDFIAFLTSHNPFLKIGVCTNGLPLDREEKLTALVKARPTVLNFSIHGGGQESLEKFMGKGCDFNKVLENMRKLRIMRDKLNSQYPKIGWKYVLFHWNDSKAEMDKARSLAINAGADFFGFDLTCGAYQSKTYYPGSAMWVELIAKGDDYDTAFRKMLSLNFSRHF